MSLAEEVQLDTEERMQKAIASVQNDMARIRTGRANPMILDRVVVEYYGNPTPVRQMANVSVQEGQTLVIQPYEKGQCAEIERAIATSDLGLPVNNDGTVLRVNIPPLTEERRLSMVKEVKKIGEDGKVAIRNIRRDGTSEIEKVGKEESLSEDLVKGYQDDIQKLTDKYTQQIDEIVSAKEEEVMQV